MIPISLIVSLEFVKVFQAYFIEKDEEMYVSQRNRYAKAQTSTINEELGQVEYIFSDKTGTLTCNEMEFKYCIIGNILYGMDDHHLNLAKQPDPPQNGVQKARSIKESKFKFKDEELEGIITNNQQYRKQSQRKANLIMTSEDGKQFLKLHTQKELIDQYFFLLASAHECLVQIDEKTKQMSYQGPSPDEITLVDAAMRMGYQYKGGSASQQEFLFLNKPKQVELLKSFEFDSTRKRMSVIIKDPEDKKIKLFIKGADNIIKARLNKKEAQPFLGFIEDKLDEFSKIGLRTLLMAMKVLSADEYAQFDKKFQGLADSKDREKELS